jgi:CubicO group peptidase (beta-lactamase class C family)
MMSSPDWVQYVLDLPMATDPGDTWVYNSGASHLLSAIIQQLSGTTTIDFAETRLFQPLGINHYWWELDPDGIPNGGAGLLLTPRDMAKLGLLYLENGRWDDQLIISADYVAAASEISANLVLSPEGDPESGYGYQFWIYPPLDGYAAHGGGGQIILVVPERELVIVTTGNDFASQVPLTDLLLDYVYPSIDGTTTPSPVIPWLGGILLVLVIALPLVTLVICFVKKRRKPGLPTGSKGE